MRHVLRPAVCYTSKRMADPSAPLRVLALTHCYPDEPCTFARIYTPLNSLQDRGQVTYTLEPIWPWRASAFRRLMRDLPNWDVVWVGRPRHYLVLPLIREARRIGKPVLIDIDDWLLERPDTYNALQWAGTATSRQTMRAALVAATAATTSTPTIAERCAALGVQAHVVPNAIDCTRFVRRPREDGPLTIGFCGTISHRDDVPLVAPALQRLLDSQAGRVRVVTAGCPIPELQGLAGYSHHESVAATDYPHLLSDLRLDIGLAPLHDTSFNQARSDIKYLEYAATGAATIASPVAEFRVSVRADRGLLVSPNTPDEWYSAILRLVDDSALRQRLATHAYTWVRSERSIAATSDKWCALFRDYATRPSRVATRPDPDPGRFERVLEHVVFRQAPYYGREIPRLLAQKALLELRQQLPAR